MHQSRCNQHLMRVGLSLIRDELTLSELTQGPLDALSWSMLRSLPPQHELLESTLPKISNAITLDVATVYFKTDTALSHREPGSRLRFGHGRGAKRTCAW